MVTTVCAEGGSRVTTERGRWYVPVPWDAADNVQAFLKRQGFRSTLCLDPADRRAVLELWPGVSPDDVLAVLGTGPTGAKPYHPPTAA